MPYFPLGIHTQIPTFISDYLDRMVAYLDSIWMSAVDFSPMQCNKASGGSCGQSGPSMTTFCASLNF